jgi:hypothetical protein
MLSGCSAGCEIRPTARLIEKPIRQEGARLPWVDAMLPPARGCDAESPGVALAMQSTGGLPGLRSGLHMHAAHSRRRGNSARCPVGAPRARQRRLDDSTRQPERTEPVGLEQHVAVRRLPDVRGLPQRWWPRPCFLLLRISRIGTSARW